MKNRIYFFTGTGNSLKVAKEIAASLPECELVAIQKDMDKAIPSGYQRIGFVFPVYFWGPPAMAVNFIKNANFPPQSDTYFFAVATYGGSLGPSLPYTRDILLEKGVNLNFGAGIKMFANAVFKYNMSKRVEKITDISNKKIEVLVPYITVMEKNRIGSTNKLTLRTYLKYMSKIHDFDRGFNVSSNCVSCSICRDICPAKNIEMVDGQPAFNHQCECCLACLHHCPKRAINYLTKTQNRRRYTHPQI